MDTKLAEFVKAKYNEVDAIVAVMATGIIIRAIAPCLEGKLVDPAIVDVDISGRFVISLLSGHYGGANELTKLIATGISATPVVTTGSEAMGKQSVEELAKNLHLKIQNPESLVAVNAAIVNQYRLCVIKVGDMKVPLATVVGYDVTETESLKEAAGIANRYDAATIITKENVTLPQNGFAKPVTFLKPLTLAVGLGARKRIAQETIVDAVKSALAKAKVPLERVNLLATVSIKRDSQSMTIAAEKLGLRMKYLDIDLLRDFKHIDLSPDSETVMRNIGVGGVCEQAALIAAGGEAKLILKKTILNGVTVAVAEGE